MRRGGRGGLLTAKLLAYADELPDRHVFGSLLGFTCGVKDFPGGAEVVVEVLHLLSHSVVLAEFKRREFGQGFFLLSRGFCCSGIIDYWRRGRSRPIVA